MNWFWNWFKRALINMGICADEEMSRELSKIDDELNAKGL